MGDLRKSSFYGEWLLPSLPVEHPAPFRAASTDIQLSGLDVIYNFRRLPQSELWFYLTWDEVSPGAEHWNYLVNSF